jgi:hypothetical protein
VKKIYSLSLILIALVAFSSCKKEFTCQCKINYVVNGKVQNMTTTSNVIRTVKKEEAQNQCKYYETEEDYLTQKAVVQHYCEIK